MRIAELAHKDGSAGSGRAWRSETDGNGNRYIWHYSTVMLKFKESDPTADLYMSIGYGSVSDQHGMNTLFRALGLPYRYVRAGGAEIVEC